MFNKFAAALIAVAVTADSGNYGDQGSLDRGDGSGDSQKNAVFANMLANPGEKVNTNVWSYMAVKNGQPIPEWHGDTVAYGAGLPKNLWYGFCARIHEASDAVDAVEAVAEVTDADGNVTTPAVEAVDAVAAKDETWDCQVIDVTISPGTVEEPISENSTWAIYDMHYVGTKQGFSFATADLVDDTKNGGAVDTDARAATNWQMSQSKTFTACYPNASDANKVDCDRPALDADEETWMKSGINAHWFRDFETASDPHQDLNLTGDFTEDATATIFAFLWGWDTPPTDSTTAPDLEVLNGGANWSSTNPYDITLFTSEAYDELITQPAAEAAAAAAAAAAADDDDDEEECPEDDADHECHDDHDHGDDGATAITAQATVLLAAIYTLAF